MRYTLLIVFLLPVLGCNGNANKSAKANTIKVESIIKQDDLTQSIERGLIVYEDFCMRCHMPAGEGVEGIYPPLANADWLINNRLESIYVVKYGQSGKITVNGESYNRVMAPMGLSDEEIADVMNYILNSWGNSTKKIVTKEEVANISK